MGLFGKKGPPSPMEVAKRARVLAYLVMRSAICPPQDMLSTLRGQWSKEDWASFETSMREKTREIASKMQAEGIWDAVSREERGLLSKSAHELSMQEQLNVSWRSEALRTLAWTLGVFDDAGRYDEETEEAENVKSCLERVNPKSASLRSPDALEEQRTVAELWHWRSRTRQIEEESGPIQLPDGITIEQVILMSAEGMVERGAFAAAIGNDFAAMGRSYRELTDEEWTIVRSITMERHFALNWACGFAPKNDWDRTPTDT